MRESAINWDEHEPTTREEFANSVSHGAAFIAALAAGPVLVYSAIESGNETHTLGATVFATVMILLYLASTLSHALPRRWGKRLFDNLDHTAIFLMIAGSYTPFMLGAMRGVWGWTLLTAVWALAAAGITLLWTGRLRSIIYKVCLYLAMGWLAVIAIKPIWQNFPPWGLFWIFAGGIAYTVGVGFFAARRIPYNHLIWHLLVIAGTTCHYIAIMWYAA
ncbi:MAG: hemolysin III family protein [Nitrospinaceae bacterium]|nr:hemolysin III family protein [Nitrospinaceae bacterium]MBT3433690.1 hemolysin III family protein [Nitrospinaceae bacterium]MBT3821476.1 hemolysin III family protein [Nitrospinaceae bacterium]MBT5369260.1 hemolysin III family protein [Nitrospinaceae bacterium]MBT5948131.1 hemolysin III family protein [Nitrospinaceae bacterium]